MWYKKVKNYFDKCIKNKGKIDGADNKVMENTPYEATVEFKCAEITRRVYRYAADRLFLDARLPDKDLRKKFINRVNAMSAEIKTAFRVRTCLPISYFMF